MSIRPVDLSGMIQRTQDVGNIKHVEDSRPIVDRYNIEVRQEKQESDLSHKVQDPEQKDNQEFRYDAREKGNNSYSGNGKKFPCRNENSTEFYRNHTGIPRKKQAGRKIICIPRE